MTELHLEFFLTHRAALVQCAAKYVGSRAWAEDVVQEAFLRFAVATETSTLAITRPLGYLHRIVRNLAFDWSQHLYPERQRNGRTARSTGTDVLMAERPVPEADLLNREQLRVIQEAVAELPQRTRLAFELRYLDELTLDQISQTLGISTSLAHKLVQDARSHCIARVESERTPVLLSCENRLTSTVYRVRATPRARPTPVASRGDQAPSISNDPSIRRK